MRYIIVLLALTACATNEVRFTRETPTAGRVQIVGPDAHTDRGMKRGEALIAKKCAGSYEKLEWGDESSGIKATRGAGFGRWESAEVPARFIEFKCTGPTR